MHFSRGRKGGGGGGGGLSCCSFYSCVLSLWRSVTSIVRYEPVGNGLGTSNEYNTYSVSSRCGTGAVVTVTCVGPSSTATCSGTDDVVMLYETATPFAPDTRMVHVSCTTNWHESTTEQEVLAWQLSKTTLFHRINQSVNRSIESAGKQASIQVLTNVWSLS